MFPLVYGYRYSHQKPPLGIPILELARPRVFLEPLQFLENPPGPWIGFLGHHDLGVYVHVTPHSPFGVRGPLSLHSKLCTHLCPRRDLECSPSIKGGHFDRGPQRGLADGHGKVQVKILTLPTEMPVGGDVDAKVKIPSPAVGPDFSLSRDSQSSSIVDARRNLHAQRFHAAGAPGRNELYTGEISYPRLIEAIRNLGYDGVFGLEYAPTIDPVESLRKTLAYLG